VTRARATTAEPQLSDIDRQALELAIEMDRKRDRATRQQIDTMLQERPWREVAEFAAYGCQCDALHLKPWQPPPCWAEIDDQDNEAGPISGRKAAAELLRRMLALGISHWHPDPLAAIEAAEAERAT
jgi:hypothetical protein